MSSRVRSGLVPLGVALACGLSLSATSLAARLDSRAAVHPAGIGSVNDDADAAFPVPVSLLRPGRNALALEGWVDGTEGAAPSLDLSLFSSPAR